MPQIRPGAVKFKKILYWQVGEVETYFSINPMPGTVTHSWEEIQNLELLPEEQGVQTCRQAPQLLRHPLERGSLQISNFKSQ